MDYLNQGSAGLFVRKFASVLLTSQYKLRLARAPGHNVAVTRTDAYFDVPHPAIHLSLISTITKLIRLADVRTKTTLNLLTDIRIKLFSKLLSLSLHEHQSSSYF